MYSNDGVIGGSEPGAGNLIAGNGGDGIYFGANPDPDRNVVQGNFIGVTASGQPLGNDGLGIGMGSGDDNTFGGTLPGAGNVIANNAKGGIGMHFHGSGDSVPVGNAILGNSIYNNGGAPGSFGLGIDLFRDDVTPNDVMDADPGPNRLQNFPFLLSAESGSLTVVGVLDSTPLRDYRIEFFANDECDDSAFGEGQEFLGALDVHTGPNAQAPFSFKSGATVPAGHFITATATDLATKDTSEFSHCIEVQQGPTPTPGPTRTPGPSETPSAKLTQGDVDCDHDVDSVDALKQLRHVAALSVSQTEPCPDIGAVVASLFGDVDCDEDVDSVDALKVLRHVAALPVTQNEPCPDIGTSLS